MILFLETVKTYTLLILPWFLVGLVLSYFLDKHINHAILKKLSGSLSYKKIFISQVLGMISPLSILSFLPVAKELTDWGVSPSLLFSFFIAERAYDLQSFFIISGLFGPRFAILNVIAIFLALFVTALSIKNEAITFHKKNNHKKDSFWKRQAKLTGIVMIGIVLGACIRTLVPEQVFFSVAGDYVKGIFSSIILGFSLYLGPIAANYPLAKAFSDLGMSPAGTFGFLTISPVFNFIVILLFGSVVGFKKTLKPFFVYTVTSIALTLIFSLFL